jgi:hypothetical protein
MVTGEEVRRFAATLPRTEVAVVRDWLKFRVRGIVYAAVSPDETHMGFGFPKEERDALVASEPDKFMPPYPSDERYHWVQVRLAALDEDEMRELILDAWRMVVPKRVAAEFLGR